MEQEHFFYHKQLQFGIKHHLLLIIILLLSFFIVSPVKANSPPVAETLTGLPSCITTGQSYTVTVTYSDPDGANNILDPYLFFVGNQNREFATSLNAGTNNHFVVKVPQTDWEWDETGNPNPLVTLNRDNSSFAKSGDIITINYNLTFTSSWPEETIYAAIYVVDKEENHSGYKVINPLGTISTSGICLSPSPTPSPTANPVITNVQIPNICPLSYDMWYNFYTTSTDADGFENIDLIYFNLYGPAFQNRELMIRLDPQSNAFSVKNPSTGNYETGNPNPLATFMYENTGVVKSGNDIKVTWPIKFHTAWPAEQINVYTSVYDFQGHSDPAGSSLRASFNLGSCLSPSPTSEQCNAITDKNQCIGGCAWYSCANNLQGGCFPRGTSNEVACPAPTPSPSPSPFPGTTEIEPNDDITLAKSNGQIILNTTYAGNFDGNSTNGSDIYYLGSLGRKLHIVLQTQNTEGVQLAINQLQADGNYSAIAYDQNAPFDFESLYSQGMILIIYADPTKNNTANYSFSVSDVSDNTTYTASDLKALIKNYGAATDLTAVTADQKMNMFDLAYAIARPGTTNRFDDPVTKKVLVLNFDPIIENSGNRRLHEVNNWQDPAVLEQQYIRDIRMISNGYVNYEIVERIDIDDIPLKQDGFDYTDDTYLACWSDHSTCHSPDTADYLQILSQYDVCDKRNRGEIDELWIWGGPWFGYYEATMTGPNAFETNGPLISGTTCTKPLHIMGFNFERDATLMLHNLTHRIEGTMNHIYDGIKYPYTGPANSSRIDTSWDRFVMRQGFSSVSSTPNGCGVVHVPPNSSLINDSSQLDWSNNATVPGVCDAFFDYPNINAVAKNTTCTLWTCSQKGFNPWWLSHLPKYSGRGPDGKWNNWWKYVLDYESATAP